MQIWLVQIQIITFEPLVTTCYIQRKRTPVRPQTSFIMLVFISHSLAGEGVDPRGENLAPDDGSRFFD